jgi:peptidoglycan/xylan/chitin deacetylase (PgdA/CDA1 family)
MPSIALSPITISITNATLDALTCASTAGLYKGQSGWATKSDGSGNVNVVINSVISTTIFLCQTVANKNNSGGADLSLYNGGKVFFDAQVVSIETLYPALDSSGAIPASVVPVATTIAQGAITNNQFIQINSPESWGIYQRQKKRGIVFEQPTNILYGANGTLATDFSTWTISVSGSNTVVRNGSDGFDGGSSALRFNLVGDAGQTYVNSPAFPALDMTGKRIQLTVRSSDVSKLLNGGAHITIYLADGIVTDYTNYVTFQLQNNTDGSVQHPLTPNNTWVTWSFPWVPLNPSGTLSRSSVTHFRFRVFSANSGSSSTFDLGRIAIVNDSTASYPKGAIALCFDDGVASQYTTAFPILKSRFVSATCYLISKALGTAGYLTVSQINEMRDWGWDPEPHSYSTATHSNPTGMSGMSLIDLITDAQLAIAFHSANGWGTGHIAYPKGFYDANVLSMTNSMFKSGRTIEGLVSGIFLENYPVSNRDRVRGVTVSNTTTLANLKTLVDLVVAQKCFLPIVFHDIVTSPLTSTQWGTSDFTALVDYILASGIPIVTMSEALG